MTTLKVKQIKKGGHKDPANWPAIPTLLKSGDVESTQSLESGYYPVKVSPQGIEYLSPTAIKHESFDTCKKACDAHNTYIGMSLKDITTLYVQRRFEHNRTIS